MSFDKEAKTLIVEVLQNTEYQNLKNSKLVFVLQVVLTEMGVNPGPIDGIFGSKTLNALQVYKAKLEKRENFERPDETISANKWPTYNQLINYYGPPGEANLIEVELPYPHRLAWDTSEIVTTTRCHHKVAKSYLRVLGKVLSEYGPSGISDLRLDMYGGCYSYRNMKGSDKKSTHSWGIAFDYDPIRNQFQWGADRASFAHTDYDKWWSFWEEEGWASLGRALNFDWMHIQAVSL